MNEENEREIRENDGERVNLEVEKISKEEVRENMKRMKNRKAVGPDDIPVEVWKCLGEIALEFLTKLYNRTLESEREIRENDGERVNLEVEKISKEEVRENMKRMKNRKAVGPDDIPVEVWKCLGEIALEFLTKLYNRTLESERKPEEWRNSVLIPIFKNKGDVQSCSNYRGIKLISHTMKLLERVVERKLRSELTFSEQ